ncbi:4-hydroxy-tetrahydrodipicolinate reductase [Dokdonella sp.]|uniref:4-hydroxy-tetrahydrodipicolinate reductase n=1 Tax=Dokdonella sp. TaxID=2291710 RepID=UPI002F3E3455
MPATTIHVAVYGAAGRMGQAILRAASAEPRLRVSAALVRAGSELAGRALRDVHGAAAPDLDFTDALDPDTPVDVLVDFSGAHAFDAALALALERRAAFVSGTTGLVDAQRDALERAAARIPLMWASNFSLGIALLMRLARDAAHALPSWDCEIVEMHHRRKLDAPSGTALSLGEAVAEGRGVAFAERAVHGRSGRTGERPEGEIGFHALRGGDVVGEHTLVFAGPGERLELAHRATDRDVFARGVVAAACWIARQAPGAYPIDRILGGVGAV